MSKIPTVAPALLPLIGTLEQIEATLENPVAAATVPANVLTAWDALRLAAGTIAPARLAAGRAKVRAFHGLVR